MSTNRRRRHIGAAIAAVTLLVTATACSDEPVSSGATDASVDPVKGVPTLNDLYAGTFTSPPETSPGGIKGKSVWFVTCGSSVPACLIPGKAAQEAGKTLGIDVTIADGKLNVGGAQSEAVRTAIAAGADGIILFGMNCTTVQQALVEAKQAGIPVLGAASTDCSDAGGPELFTAPMVYSETIKNGYDWFYDMGAKSADYIINKTGGKARIIYSYNTTESQLIAADRGFRDEWAKCDGCSMAAEFTAELTDHVPGGAWVQQFRSALVAHPDVNGIYLEWDVFATALGGIQAVREAGLRDVLTFGGEGVAETFDLVRDGQMTALTKVSSREWLGYAAMDNMARALHGEPAAPQGLGHIVTDIDHNLPEKPGTAWTGPEGVDFKAQYEKLWREAAG